MTRRIPENVPSVPELFDTPNTGKRSVCPRVVVRVVVEGALANVEINLESLGDESFTREVRQKAAALRG
ncbi:MAG TPA: hypothetical protein VJQ50_04190 [Terriglobales bacterium]|nr:hypothetical protein [Terriglobales bacterium]